MWSKLTIGVVAALIVTVSAQPGRIRNDGGDVTIVPGAPTGDVVFGTLGGVKAILASVDQRVTKEAAATTHGELVIKIEGDVDVVQQALDDFKDEAGLKLTEETEKVSEKVDTLGARVAVLDDMASECGAAGHLYTKDGCKEIPIPDANLAKYDGKGCNTDNAGLLHYHKINGEVCLMICDATTWLASNEGGLGGRCNPAKDCATVASAKKHTGTYQFISKSAGGVTTESIGGYCNVATKKISYDGSSAAKFALSCNDLFTGFPNEAQGEKYIGASASAAKKLKCTKIVVEAGADFVPIPTNNLHTWWDAADFDGTNMKAKGGTLKGKNPTFYGSKPTKAVGGGKGAHSKYVSLKGVTSTHRIRWGDITKSSWTLCTTSRYEGSGSKGRIFTGYRNNWLHGHWGHNTGSSYYQGWKINGKRNSKRYDWLVWCATSGNDRDIWMNNLANNGVQRVSSNKGMTRTYEVGTGWGTHSGERSDYRIGEVISWSRSLKGDEMKLVSEYLLAKVTGKA